MINFLDSNFLDEKASWNIFLGLLLIVSCPLSVVDGQGYRPAQERNAYDYFDRVGDKSYYQQQD